MRRKKERTCIQCGNLYDYMERGRKRTCSTECETALKNKKEQIMGTYKEDCQRCGKKIPNKETFCDRCLEINRELMKFKEEMVCKQ